MNPLLKILLCIPLAINALFTLTRLLAGIERLLHPLGLADELKETILLLVTCGSVFGVLWWAFHQIVVQEKASTGTGLIMLSYAIWPLSFLITLMVVNRPWH